MGEGGIDEIEEMGEAINGLTGTLIKCIIEVHKELGPGFLENIYKNALILELQKNGLTVETEKEIEIFYKGQSVGSYRLDIIVNNLIVLELKTVESIIKIHYAQLRSYLKASGCKTGFIVNFSLERADFRRVEIDSFIS
jgi:GxxExxY protein